MILGTNGAGRGHRKSILQPPSLDRFAARPGLAPEGSLGGPDAGVLLAVNRGDLL